MTDSKSTTETNSTETRTKVSKAKKRPASGSAPASSQRPSSSRSSRSAPAKTTIIERKSGTGIAVLAMILSIGALAGVGFSWYQNQVASVQQESSLAIGVSEIGGEVSRIGDNVARLQQQQTAIVSQDKLNLEVQKIASEIDDRIIGLNLENRFSDLSDQQIDVQEALLQLNSDLKSGVNAYAVEEVSQLLKLANQNIVFTRNLDTALSALSLADLQLQGLNDPRYSSVRIKIAEEITQLENIERVDIEGLSARLSAVSDSVPSLPLANEPPATKVNLVNTTTETGSGWRYEVAKLWDEIKSSIQVQRVDQPPKPLLAPEQRYFLNQNLQLSLKTAQLALLQERPTIFQSNVESARLWLLDYFDTGDSQVADIVEQLDAMALQKVAPTLPSITGSYQALQEIRGGQ